MLLKNEKESHFILKNGTGCILFILTKKKSSYRYHGNIIKVTSISDRLTKRLKRPLLQPVFARNFNFEQGHNRQTEEAGVCSLNSRM